jgi:hypothetical protein
MENENNIKKEQFQELLSVINDIKLTNQEGQTLQSEKKSKSNIMKYISLIKIMSTMRIMKEDKEPVEIIPNVYIGSIGAASNKDSLKKNNITHIVCAASNIKIYFPEVFINLTR